MIGNYFGPVDRTVSVLIDRAYPVVKAVYLRLDDIKIASDNVDTLKFVVENLYLYQQAEDVAKVILPIAKNLDEILQTDDNAQIASASAVKARNYYELSKQWAIKTEDAVVGEDYSSKYWALKAGEVSKVIETAIEDMNIFQNRIDVVEPILNVVEDNIEDIQDVANNLGPINIISGDLTGEISPLASIDMGRVGTGDTTQVEITGGNIKIVADNIEDVQVLGNLAEAGKIDIAINSVETTNQNVIKAKESETNAAASANLAKDWATKVDGLVNNEEYSAKYYAQQAKNSADNTVSSTEDIVNTIAQGRVEIQQLGEAQVLAVNTAGSTQVGLVNSAGITQTSNVNDAGDLQVQTVKTEGSTQVEALKTASQEQLNQIDSVSSAQITNITQEGQTQIEAVNTAGTTQKGIVNKAGTDAVASVNSSRDAIVQAVTDEGTKQIGLIQTEGTTQKTAVTTEGTTQISSVQKAGTAQVSAVTSAGQTQIGLVEDEGETQVQLVDTEGTTQRELIATEGESQVSAVNSAGSTQVDAITAEGTKQVGLVTSAGTEKLSAINTAGESHLSAVNNAGSTQVSAVNAAGAAQVELVNSAVGTSLESINTSVQKAKDWAEKMDGEVESGAYSAKYWAQQASTGQVQANWNESDSGSKSFIQNKPDLSVYALKSDISSIYKPKGSVDTYGQLPSDAAIGDVYNIATDDRSNGIKAGDNVVWTGSYWDNLSGFIDLAPYLTSEAASGIYLRQDTASTTYATKSELSGYALSTSLNQYLSLAGGTVTGTTNFTAGASFTGNVTVPTPTTNTQAANKSYVDTAVSSIDLSGYLTKSDAQSTYLKITGGNITGNLNVSNFSVSESATFAVSPKVPEPGLLTDAANKQYVDTTVSTLSNTVSQQYVSNTKLTEQMALKANKEHTHTTVNITNFTEQVQELINNSKITDYGRVGS